MKTFLKILLSLAMIAAMLALFLFVPAEDDPNNVKYANRWIRKGQEINKTIDEAYAQNPAININEIFEGLAKLEKEINEGTVDIDRE